VSSGPHRFARPRTIAPPAGAGARVAARPALIARARSTRTRALAEVAAGLIVVAAVSWPLVFTEATFNTDWLNHLWYMWHQSVNIREHLEPTLYLNYAGGVLYPFYAFYGGTLYALAGTLSLVLGDAPLRTYVLSYLLGFAAAYGGFYWAARQFGVRGWRAHVPGIVFVTSSSYLMTIYAFGDWPEFLATSAIPLMIAAALSVLRAPQLRFWPALALVLSSVVFFGSHLITLIWGSTILAIAAALLLACVPGVRRSVSRAGVLRVVALMLPAAMLSAWFLLPTVAYEAHTLVAHAYPHERALLRELMYTVAARNLFTLSHKPVPGTIASTALPVAAIAWVLVGGVLLAVGRRRSTQMRVLLVLAAATVAVAVVMTHAGLILALPRMYATLQFSFRLEGFVLLGLGASMVVLLVAARDGGAQLRRWTWLLVPVAALSLAGAIQQTSLHHEGDDRSSALSYPSPPPERFGQYDYVDDRLPEINRPLPRVEFPLAAMTQTGHATEVVNVPAGRLLATNIRGDSDLLRVTGARIVGLDTELDDVIELPASSGARGASSAAPGASTRTDTVTLAPAETTPMLAGRAISLAALAILVGELALLAVRGIRARSSTRSPRRAPAPPAG